MFNSDVYPGGPPYRQNPPGVLEQVTDGDLLELSKTPEQAGVIVRSLFVSTIRSMNDNEHFMPCPGRWATSKAIWNEMFAERWDVQIPAWNERQPTLIADGDRVHAVLFRNGKVLHLEMVPHLTIGVYTIVAMHTHSASGTSLSTWEVDIGGGRCATMTYAGRHVLDTDGIEIIDNRYANGTMVARCHAGQWRVMPPLRRSDVSYKTEWFNGTAADLIGRYMEVYNG
jgi:hypothetical protein